MTKDINERLAGLRIEMPQEARHAHLAEIRRELLAPGPVAERVRRRPLRRLVATSVAAAVLLVPTAAIASDDAVPGEVLYPVKRAVEWPWSLVDADVGPRHRVEELEAVIERNEPLAVIEARLEAAEGAVEDASDLAPRLERARLRIRAQYGLTDSDDRGRGPGQPGTTDGGSMDSGTSGSVSGDSSPTTAPEGPGATDQSSDDAVREQTRDRDRSTSTTGAGSGNGRSAP